MTFRKVSAVRTNKKAGLSTAKKCSRKSRRLRCDSRLLSHADKYAPRFLYLSRVGCFLITRSLYHRVFLLSRCIFQNLLSEIAFCVIKNLFNKPNLEIVHSIEYHNIVGCFLRFIIQSCSDRRLSAVRQSCDPADFPFRHLDSFLFAIRNSQLVTALTFRQRRQSFSSLVLYSISLNSLLHTPFAA